MFIEVLQPPVNGVIYQGRRKVSQSGTAIHANIWACVRHVILHRVNRRQFYTCGYIIASAVIQIINSRWTHSPPPPPPPPSIALVQANYVGASLVSTVHTCAQFPQLVGIPHSHCVTDPYTYIYYFRLLSLNRGCKLASFPGSPLCTYILIASDELWTHVKIILRGSKVITRKYLRACGGRGMREHSISFFLPHIIGLDQG